MSQSKNALMAGIAGAPASVASSSKSSSSSSSFDSVYAAAQANKSNAAIIFHFLVTFLQLESASAQLEMSRSQQSHEEMRQSRGFTHEERKQSRDFAFQAQRVGLEMAASRAEHEAERHVRQRIEFERNATKLLEKDPTGALAKDLVSLVDTRFGEVQRNDLHGDRVLNLLETFMNRFS
jgi:hypothetical protein